MTSGVEVVDWRDAARIDLDTVYNHYEANKAGLGSHLWDWFTGEIQKGVEKTELMLTNGTTLTGIGKLVKGETPLFGITFCVVMKSVF